MYENIVKRDFEEEPVAGGWVFSGDKSQGGEGGNVHKRKLTMEVNRKEI